jgi:hypothetical protein
MIKKFVTLIEILFIVSIFLIITSMILRGIAKSLDKPPLGTITLCTNEGSISQEYKVDAPLIISPDGTVNFKSRGKTIIFKGSYIYTEYKENNTNKERDKGHDQSH